MKFIARGDLAYKKVCARWVPRILTDEHKQKQIGAAPERLWLQCSGTERVPYSSSTCLERRPQM